MTEKIIVQACRLLEIAYSFKSKEGVSVPCTNKNEEQTQDIVKCFLSH